MTERQPDGKPADPDTLLAKIRQAERGADRSQTEPAADSQSSDLAKKAGIEFGSTVLGGVLLGILLDSSFGLMPWCTLGFTAGGFTAGLLRAWKAMER
jgi:F0F1-type ATP synthase assembly protein I